MSRSAFLTTNEIPTTADRRFHHDLILTSRSSETTIPIVKQSSTTNKSMTQMNRRIKRNLRDKRRSTGIRPNDISLASTSTEGSANEDEAENDEEENNSSYIAESHDTFDHNRNLSSLKPMFTVSRIQSSLENVSISRTDPYIITSTPPSATKMFRPQEFFVRRVEKQTNDDDSSMIKCRQLEEHIRTLESLLHEKDSLIYDLQRKLDNTTRNLTDAEQQIYLLHQDKLTLIQAFTTLQDDKSSTNELSKCSNFVTRKN